MPSDAARADRGKGTGSSEERSSARSLSEVVSRGRSELLADEAIADSSTTEKKVRQQVEQRD